MSSILPPVPHRAPFVDLNGFLTPVWSDFFQKLYLRAGGSVAETNDELYTVNTARIENGAITADKIAAAVAGNGLTGGAGFALSVGVDGSTIEIATDALQVKDLGISTAKIADGAASFVKLLSTDWSSSNAASGYQKLGSGIYLQWGVTASIGSGTNTAQTFPIAFPTACRQVVAGIQGNSAGSTIATGHFGTGNYSTTGFDMYNRTSASYVFNWIAVGY